VGMFAEIIGIHDYPEVIFSLIGANFADVHRSLGALTPFLVPASVYVSRAARPCRWVSTGQTSMHPAGQLGGIPRSRELCRRILPARSGVPPVAPNRLPRAGPFFCNNLQIGLRTRSQGVVPKAESRLGPGGSEASAVAFEDAPFSTNNCGRRHPFGFSFTPAGLLFPYVLRHTTFPPPSFFHCQVSLVLCSSLLSSPPCSLPRKSLPYSPPDLFSPPLQLPSSSPPVLS